MSALRTDSITPFTSGAAISFGLSSFPEGISGSLNVSGAFSGVFRSNASTTGSASINLPHGTAPTSPVNGDLWTTNSGLYVQISGSSIGPLTTGAGGGTEGSNLYLWESCS